MHADLLDMIGWHEVACDTIECGFILFGIDMPTLHIGADTHAHDSRDSGDLCRI